MCCPYRQKGYHRCFRRLPAFEHTQQSVHELIWLRGTRSAIRWRRRSLTVCSRRMRRQQTYRRRRTSSRLHWKFRSRLRCASKSLLRNVSCYKATNQWTEHQFFPISPSSILLMGASLVSIGFCSKALADSLVEQSCVASKWAICAHFFAQLPSISFSVSWVAQTASPSITLEGFGGFQIWLLSTLCVWSFAYRNNL